MAISDALAWQLNNGGSADTLYATIRDFLAKSPDAASTQAQMAQYGISGEDVANATGGKSGGLLSGNILAGASWNSLNKTLGDELTAATGQATSNYAVGGATTADTLAQLNTYLAGGGQFDPNATVYLQTGGVDFITGVDKDTVKSNINQIVKTLGAQGVDVVLTGSPYAKSIDDVINNNFDPKVDQIFTDIAKENKNVALVGVQGEILQNKKLLVDALHTNAEGTAIYNQAVIDSLSQFKNEVPSSTPQAIAQVQQTNTVATTPAVITQAASVPAVAQTLARAIPTARGTVIEGDNIEAQIAGVPQVVYETRVDPNNKANWQTFNPKTGEIIDSGTFAGGGDRGLLAAAAPVIGLAASTVGLPFISSLLGGATGLTGSALAGATGATISGATNAIAGGNAQDILKAALLGGAGAFGGSAISDYLKYQDVPIDFTNMTQDQINDALDVNFANDLSRAGLTDAQIKSLIANPASVYDATQAVTTPTTPVAVSTPVTDVGGVTVTAPTTTPSLTSLLSSITTPAVTVTAPKTPQQVDQATLDLIASQLSTNVTKPDNLATVNVTGDKIINDDKNTLNTILGLLTPPSTTTPTKTPTITVKDTKEPSPIIDTFRPTVTTPTTTPTVTVSDTKTPTISDIISSIITPSVVTPSVTTPKTPTPTVTVTDTKERAPIIDAFPTITPTITQPVTPTVTVTDTKTPTITDIISSIVTPTITTTPTVTVTDRKEPPPIIDSFTPTVTPVISPVTPVTPVTPPVTPPTITDIIKVISVIPIIDAIVNPPTPPTVPTFPIVDIPPTWTPPTPPTVSPFPPLPPIDFGNRNLLRGTQWEKFLDPNYGQVPAPVQYSQPSNLSYNDLMGILGSRQGMPAKSSLSINDVISGIQNQYGQTPTRTMG